MRSQRQLRPALSDSRRTRTSYAVGIGTALAVVAVTGLTAASASADIRATSADDLSTTVSSAIFTASPASAPIVPDETLREVTDEAKATLESARTAVATADSTTAAVAASGLDVGLAQPAVRTTTLRHQISRLSGLDIIPLFFLPSVTDATAAETDVVTAQTAQLRAHLNAAQAKKAAAEAAAKAKAVAAAKATAVRTSNTPAGAKASARAIASSEHGWGSDQFSCLESLWNRESGWNYRSYNASSGATGIPQALPGSKMASAGSDWKTSAATQIRWGLDYIARGYGSPCGAWSHSQATGWY